MRLTCIGSETSACGATDCPMCADPCPHHPYQPAPLWLWPVAILVVVLIFGVLL